MFANIRRCSPRNWSWMGPVQLWPLASRGMLHCVWWWWPGKILFILCALKYCVALSLSYSEVSVIHRVILIRISTIILIWALFFTIMGNVKRLFKCMQLWPSVSSKWISMWQCVQINYVVVLAANSHSMTIFNPLRMHTRVMVVCLCVCVCVSVCYHPNGNSFRSLTQTKLS